MAQATPSATPRLDRSESQDSLGGDVLKRGSVAADAIHEPVFPLSKGIPKSTRLKLGAKDSIMFWLMVTTMHLVSLLPDFILYRLGILGGLIFHRFDHRHRKIGI